MKRHFPTPLKINTKGLSRKRAGELADKLAEHFDTVESWDAAEITAILGTNADDAKYDGIIVWRKFGDAEIVDTPNTKTISGKADPEKVTALLKVLSNYGCTA